MIAGAFHDLARQQVDDEAAGAHFDIHHDPGARRVARRNRQAFERPGAFLVVEKGIVRMFFIGQLRQGRRVRRGEHDAGGIALSAHLDAGEVGAVEHVVDEAPGIKEAIPVAGQDLGTIHRGHSETAALLALLVVGDDHREQTFGRRAEFPFAVETVDPVFDLLPADFGFYDRRQTREHQGDEQGERLHRADCIRAAAGMGGIPGSSGGGGGPRGAC